MARSVRRPQQIFYIVMWLLSLLFAAILIGLGSLIIADLPRVDAPITVQQFIDSDKLAQLKEREAPFLKKQQAINRQLEDARASYNSASADYNSARASLNDWLATRRATEEQQQNPEVITRTRAVEQLKLKERAALRRLELVRAQSRNIVRDMQDLQTERRTLTTAARPAYKAAIRSQVLKVFLLRLALTLPLLLIAGWLIAKKRDSSYWPLHRGFVIFALFAFFVELVPYLPSYGGYIRYVVGILLILIAGHYSIRAMNRYMARKKSEESRSEGERRQSIEYETALKKISAKTCPGCDRAIVTHEGSSTFFCAHCGIRLREKCTSCGATNISFHRFCLSCGEPTKTDEGSVATPAEQT